MQRLAQGELSATVIDQDRDDEIGGMGRAFQIFKDALIAKKDLDKARENGARMR